MKSPDNFEFSKKCPLCGNNLSWRIFKSKDSADSVKFNASGDTKWNNDIYKCSICNHVYAISSLDIENILTDYENLPDERFVSQFDNRFLTFRRNIKWALKLIDKNERPLNALDIGTGSGACVKAANSLGISAKGVEPSKWLVDWIHSNHKELDVIQGFLEDICEDDLKKDLIMNWDVIEHVENPLKFAKLLSSNLSTGSHILISTPNWNSKLRILLGKYWPMHLDVHLHYFHDQTFLRIFNNLDFILVRKKRLWQTLDLGYILTRYLSGTGIHKLSNSWLVRKIRIRYYVGQSIYLMRKL